MSASLVGSEMCIRDSHQRIAFGKQSRNSMTRTGARLVITACCVASSETVSYTHLTLPTICSV
eukprot:14229450-Alexandrium_andersonii.AAC.1